MPRSFRFNPGVAVPGTSEAAASFQLQEEATLYANDWADLEAAVLLANLVDDPSGKKRLDSALADTAKRQRIVPITASGIRGVPNYIYPPEAADPATWTVYVNTVDLALGVVSGRKFVAALTAGAVAAGAVLAVEEAETMTDANGYAQLIIPADIGSIKILLGGITAVVDTAGRAGAVVNYKDLI